MKWLHSRFKRENLAKDLTWVVGKERNIRNRSSSPGSKLPYLETRDPGGGV